MNNKYGLKYIEPITGNLNRAGYQRQYRLKKKEYMREYRLKNKEKTNEYSKEYYLKNKEKMNQYTKEYRLKNKEKILLKQKEYHLKHKEQRKQYILKNKEKINQYTKEYRLKNKEKILEQRNEYNKNRKKTDIGFRIASNLRVRLYHALKGNDKTNSTMKLLGCSISDFKKHIESLFKPWMAWENYGKWNIDHIIPCAAFDLTIPEQQQRCFHYSNLQPLDAIENIKKGSYYNNKRYGKWKNI